MLQLFKNSVEGARSVRLLGRMPAEAYIDSL